jgi:virulence factor Mce-like protein
VNSRLLLEIRRSLRPFIYFLILAVLGTAAFAGIFRNLTFERPWQNYREVRAEFDDVKGVFPGGHQVRINGVKVGVVSKADLVDGNRAVLTLKLEEKWGPIYTNAKMRIRPVTPLQDLYVNITDRGDKSAGEAKERDIIAAQQTISPVDISRVLNTFSGNTRERMTMLLSELGTGLEDGGVKLRESFASLAPFLKVAQRTTAVLAKRDRNVRRLVHNFGRLSAALAKRDKELNEFVTEGNETLGELAANDRQFGATFTSLAQLMPVMRSSFTSLRGLSDELDPALTSLKPVAAELEKGLVGLQQFGQDAQPALKKLRPAFTDLRTMARQLSPTSRSLATAFQRFQVQAPSYDRLTKQTVTCLDSMDRFFGNTMSVLKFEDGYGSYPRAETTVDTDSASTGAGLNTTPRKKCTDALGGVTTNSLGPVGGSK